MWGARLCGLPFSDRAFDFDLVKVPTRILMETTACWARLIPTTFAKIDLDEIIVTLDNVAA